MVDGRVISFCFFGSVALVQKEHLVAASQELVAFDMDLCEQICDGNADCIKDCHRRGLTRMAEFIGSINPASTSPSQLHQMVSDYKVRVRSRR